MDMDDVKYASKHNGTVYADSDDIVVKAHSSELYILCKILNPLSKILFEFYFYKTNCGLMLYLPFSGYGRLESAVFDPEMFDTIVICDKDKRQLADFKCAYDLSRLMSCALDHSYKVNLLMNENDALQQAKSFKTENKKFHMVSTFGGLEFLNG